MKNKIFVIAEAGVNHNGSISIAEKMIDLAAMAGADAIKFQTFKAENVISRYAPKAEYQKINTSKKESQLEMVKKFELSQAMHRELLSYCGNKKIMFLSTPFDLDSIDLLHKLGLKLFKIPSGEITNLPYLRKIGSLRKKLIISTGMSTLQEVKDALSILVKSGTNKKDITVLHCSTEYPTPFADVNLYAMLTIKNQLKVAVGYSDHTLGIEVALAAATLGATVIEKHFTLDKNMLGPDHKASLEPEELRMMVRGIRNIELALGSGIKCPSNSESKNIRIARKSIVASRAIRKGERFSTFNITVKRPGTGISPMKWDSVLRRVAKKNFNFDELIKI